MPNLKVDAKLVCACDDLLGNEREGFQLQGLQVSSLPKRGAEVTDLSQDSVSINDTY